MKDLNRGVAAVGQWIEEHGDETDYSSDEYDGQAWIIYPAEVAAMKRGELPQPEDKSKK